MVGAAAAVLVYRGRDKDVSDTALDALKGRLALTRCDLYVWWWSLGKVRRRAYVNGAGAVASAAMVPVLLDVAAMFVGHRLIEFHLPVLVQIAIAAAAFVLARHRVHEWKRTAERSRFATAMRFALHELGALNFNCPPTDRTTRLDEFVTKVLAGFHNVYAERLNARLNVMAYTEKDELRIQYVYPIGSAYDPKAVFASGSGAAGCAFQQRHLVYVPAIKYLHGLTVTLPQPSDTIPAVKTLLGATAGPASGQPPAASGAAGAQANGDGGAPCFKVAKEVYVRVDHEPYACVLTAPIVTTDGTGYGVLNVDCDVQNAFSDVDMEIADIAARTLVLGIDRYRSALG